MYRFSRIICANYRRFGSFRNQIDFKPQFPKFERKNKTFLLGASGFLSGLFNNEEPEEEESELIMTIKRGVLSVQREEFPKAEQMFHLALRMAQQVNNELAVSYIYDLLANLAYEIGDLTKAEKLFTSVIQRLMTLEQAAEDDIRLLHISTKIAHISYLKNDLDKALLGFEYVLGKIETRDFKNDENLLELWGLVKNFLGQAYISLRRHTEAKEALLDALKVFQQFKDEASEDGMVLLNNLSCACTELKEYEIAEQYLQRAITIAKEMKPEFVDVAPYHVNLGMLYMKQKLIEKAQKSCKYAWQIAKKYENKEAIDGADHCLDQVKKVLSSS